MEFFDSHAHYDDEKFNSDREEVIHSMYEEGVTHIISAGYNLASSEISLQLSNEYDFIYSTCGISPNDIPETSLQLNEQLQEIARLANHEKIVAIGEIGLDYYYTKENKELQIEAFMKQIEIANSNNLPIVIHTRDAVQDTLNVLKHRVTPAKLGVFHCCALNRELVKEALKLGFYISFAGPITFKNSKNAEEIIKMVPIERIMIETDSPYLSPEPNRGKRNDSRNLKYIAQKIADVKKITIEEVAKITVENVKQLFQIN